MEIISNNDKEKLISFIKENELDYIISNNELFKFHTTSHDNMKFFFYIYEGNYIVVKYDKNKDMDSQAGQMAYEYYTFQNFQQVLEQISFYDNNLSKTWFYPVTNSIEIGFDEDSYTDEWVNEMIKDEFYTTEDCNNYKCITYNNPNYKPELKSPFNTLHEVSTINDIQFTKIDKLYFEVHPISLQDGNESYLVKLACNNEEILKEYINYMVIRKKGLKIFMETMFNDFERFKS